MQSLGDTFGQVFLAIRANKLRSFLTMFGIAWGVGSLLLLVGVGEGFRSGQQHEFAELGNDVIMMWNGNIPAVPGQHSSMRPYYLTTADLAAIRTEAPAVRAATGFVRRDDIKQQSLYETAGGQVMGVEPNFASIRFVPVVEGRFISNDDMVNKNRVIFLGEKSAKLLFPGHPSVGQYVTLNGTRFLVIGVAGHMGHADNDNQSQQVFIPLSVMLDMFPINWGNNPADTMSSIQYQPVTADQHEAALAQVHEIIARRHGFNPNASDAFEEWDSIESQKMVGRIFDAMDIFLGGVGLVTLALGAVGIVNIMLVSVTERTREIGLRKALGATSRSIMVQFFLEGLLLTAVSGLIGVMGSAFFMWLLNTVIGHAMEGFDPPRIQPWSAAMAIVSLSVCGIVAGLYPAAQAAAMEPVEALRRE
ncbi:MAG TPA: ABC transporter permease [Acidobacteriaceae bacterium]|nr:ABC transporter permease [Acidobacteriaceae bacterium]